MFLKGKSAQFYVVNGAVVPQQEGGKKLVGNKKCKICGSHAINHHLYNRDGSDGDLCDVHYWYKRARISAGAIFDILERLWSAGFETIHQDGRWHLFAPDGEGIISGKTFRELCVNIVLEDIDA